MLQNKEVASGWIVLIISTPHTPHPPSTHSSRIHNAVVSIFTPAEGVVWGEDQHQQILANIQISCVVDQ